MVVGKTCGVNALEVFPKGIRINLLIVLGSPCAFQVLDICAVSTGWNFN